MPADAFLDTIDVECDTLSIASESIFPEMGAVEILPPLTITDRRSMMSLRVAVLSNAFVEAVLAVDLGGRLIQLRDRRTGIDIIPLPSGLSIVPEGPRGAQLRQGVEIIAGGLYRSNGLGPVEVSVHEPEDDDAPASVLLHELIPGQPASWQAKWTLAPDSAAITLEFSMIRRDLDLTHTLDGCMSGLQFHGVEDFWLRPQGIIAMQSSGHGVAIECGPGTFDGVWSDRLIRRWCWQTSLAPHQVDHWMIKLHPFSELSGVPWLGSSGLGTLNSEQLEFQALTNLENAKVVVHLADGQVMEAPLAVTPEVVSKMDLTGLPAPVRQAAILDGQRQEILRMEADNTPAELIGELDGFTEDHPRIASREGSRKNGALIRLAIDAIEAQNFQIADRYLEEALMAQGDDWLGWWLKAAVRRLGGLEGEEPTELLNAHYLAPLEPMLRAESFLRLPMEMTKEPSAILKPLANHPDAQAELVCTLMECAMWNDAARLADEFLRHRDHAMLHLLLAWSLLKRTNMAAEAAEHVRRAEALPVEAPHPWRPMERRAVCELAEQFPNSERLGRLKKRLCAR